MKKLIAVFLCVFCPVVFAQSKIDVPVIENSLAIIAGQEGSSDVIQRIAENYAFKAEQINKDGFYRLTAVKAYPREKLELIAEEIKTTYAKADVVRAAGLLSYDNDQRNYVLLPLEIIVEFHQKLSGSDIAKILAQYDVSILRKPLKYLPNQYVLSLAAGKDGVAALVTNLSSNAYVNYAHPNYWKIATTFDVVPFDPLFGNQWHHRNTGQGGGLVDADADTSWAWDFGLGDSDVVIAVADTGFDMDHEDLEDNLYINPAEVAGNGIDDDGNGFVDDVSGWDFTGNDNNPEAQGTENHGTAVSGVALARSDNVIGVAGSCPQCSWMPLRIASPFISDAGMISLFNYVAIMDVDIMNNSWGYTSTAATVSAGLTTAINNAANAGVMIFFAAGNGNSSGWCGGSFPSLNASVVAVSSSTNLDQKVTESAWGSCIDILTPSHRGYNAPFMGTLNVTTTDREGTAGYNSTNLVTGCPSAETADNNYTNCFGGTSSASPFTAGIAGLIKSADSSLNRTQIQQIIQDTADKIVPSTANYNDNTGYSSANTHAYGRINAYEATRVAASNANGGRGNVDIFVRDNVLDWGNTTGYLGEQRSNVRFESPRTSIGHWQSEDIKVDAPPYQAVPTAATFDAFVDEKPSLSAGDVNRAYVRVRNRGHVAAVDVDVKLMWTQFGTALPALNGDFWTQYPGDSLSATNAWTSAECSASGDSFCNVNSIAYSGASVAGTASDNAAIVAFEFAAPTYDPNKANHYCLFAVTDAANDPVDPLSKIRFTADSITPNDNNATHRNYTNLDTSNAVEGFFQFYIRNPLKFAVESWIEIDLDPSLKEYVRYDVKGFIPKERIFMKAGEERLVGIYVNTTNKEVSGDIHVAQYYKGKESVELMGGLSIDVSNRSVKNTDEKEQELGLFE